jgi:hypothetical protein
VKVEKPKDECGLKPEPPKQESKKEKKKMTKKNKNKPDRLATEILN